MDFYIQSSWYGHNDIIDLIKLGCQFQGLEEVIAVSAAVEQEGRARKRRKMLPPPFVLFLVAGVNYLCGIDRALNYS